MIKIENVVTPSPEQWAAVIRGMRNPMNSWDKSDSRTCSDIPCGKWEMGNENCGGLGSYCIGSNDLQLMQKLFAAGSDHRKFMRMITVYADISAPLYWWKEFDTYKVGTVTNSCSTMHKIASKEFTLDDFSHDNIHDTHVYQLLLDIIDSLNEHRKAFNMENDPVFKKEHWWQMIRLLPSSYNQRRTVMLNYEVLANMNRDGRRRNHKLDEWREFCKWIDGLPYYKAITDVKEKQK